MGYVESGTHRQGYFIWEGRGTSKEVPLKRNGHPRAPLMHITESQKKQFSPFGLR